MLVNVKDMLTKAVAGHYAVGHFNINNLEWTKAILETAQEMNSPVILGVSEGAGKYMGGFKTVAAMADAMTDSWVLAFPWHFTLITEHTRDVLSVSRRDFHP